MPGAIQLRRDPDRVSLVAPVARHEWQGRRRSGRPRSRWHARTQPSRGLKRTALLISTAVAAGLTLLLMAMARVVVVGPLAKLAARPSAWERAAPSKIDMSQQRRGRPAGQRVAQHGRRRSRCARSASTRATRTCGWCSTTSARASSRSTARGRCRTSARASSRIGSVPSRARRSSGTTCGAFDPRSRDNFEVGLVGGRRPVPAARAVPGPAAEHRQQGRAHLELDYRPISTSRRAKPAGQDDRRHHRRHRAAGARALRAAAARNHEHVPPPDRRSPGVRASSSRRRARWSARRTADHGDLAVIRRQVHTLKGNCALFGIESVAAAVPRDRGSHRRLGIVARRGSRAPARSVGRCRRDARRADRGGRQARDHESRARTTRGCWRRPAPAAPPTRAAGRRDRSVGVRAGRQATRADARADRATGDPPGQGRRRRRLAADRAAAAAAQVGAVLVGLRARRCGTPSTTASRRPTSARRRRQAAARDDPPCASRSDERPGAGERSAMTGPGSTGRRSRPSCASEGSRARPGATSRPRCSRGASRLAPSRARRPGAAWV